MSDGGETLPAAAANDTQDGVHEKSGEKHHGRHHERHQKHSRSKKHSKTSKGESGVPTSSVSVVITESTAPQRGQSVAMVSASASTTTTSATGQGKTRALSSGAVVERDNDTEDGASVSHALPSSLRFSQDADEDRSASGKELKRYNTVQHIGKMQPNKEDSSSPRDRRLRKRSISGWCSCFFALCMPCVCVCVCVYGCVHLRGIFHPRIHSIPLTAHLRPQKPNH
jgi:hypothetical protein